MQDAFFDALRAEGAGEQLLASMAARMASQAGPAIEAAVVPGEPAGTAGDEDMGEEDDDEVTEADLEGLDDAGKVEVYASKAKRRKEKAGRLVSSKAGKQADSKQADKAAALAKQQREQAAKAAAV